MPLNLALTAGYDTRMMLACARNTLATTAFFTLDLGDVSSWRDTTVSQRIAARHGLSHRLLRKRSRRSDLKRWIVRTAGEAGEPRGWRASRAFAEEGKGQAIITGSAADVARIGGMRRKALHGALTPEAILSYCTVHRRPEFLARAERWLGSLAKMDAMTVADLLFLEQRKGCKAGVIAYGELGNSSARLSPLTSRTLVERALRLPIEYRLTNRLNADVIQTWWPELLDFPFNDELSVPSARARYFKAKQQVTATVEGKVRLVRRTYTRLGSRNGNSH
jgi:hypothetical protein